MADTDELVERLRVVVEKARGNIGLVRAEYACDAADHAEFDKEAEELEAVQGLIVAALRAQRNEVVEECARVADKRAVMYRGKSEQHDSAAPDTFTLRECLASNAEACEWDAAAIRNLKSQDQPK
jgi:fructoselysine-6-P-deglycase FrlB-like protein